MYVHIEGKFYSQHFENYFQLLHHRPMCRKKHIKYIRNSELFPW